MVFCQDSMFGAINPENANASIDGLAVDAAYEELLNAAVISGQGLAAHWATAGNGSFELEDKATAFSGYFC